MVRWRNTALTLQRMECSCYLLPATSIHETSTHSFCEIYIFPAYPVSRGDVLSTRHVQVHGQPPTGMPVPCGAHRPQVYKGKDEILLSELILNPSHSILTQSFDSRLRLVTRSFCISGGSFDSHVTGPTAPAQRRRLWHRLLHLTLPWA